MTAPVAIPGFRRVWLGELVNIVGDAIYTVAIALYVLPRKDAPHALGIVLGLAAVGGIVSLLVGGALADRYRRGRMIIASDVIQAGAVAGMVMVGRDAPLYVLGAFAALLGIGSGLYRPAYSSILPTLVPEGLIPQANSLAEVSSRLGGIAGAGIGGAIAIATSPAWALVVDAATFVVSMTALAGLKEAPPRHESDTGRSLASDIADGVRYVLKRPWMAGVMLQGTVQMALVAAPVAVLLPVLTGPRGWFGYITAAEAVGALCGASLASGFKSASRGWVAMLALLAQLPQVVLLAVHASPMLILPASALTGAGLAVFAVVWTTALQTGVPRGQLGRVFSLDQLTVAGLMPVGYLLAGWLLGGLGVSALAWTAAVALAASVLVVLPLPGLRHLGDGPQFKRKTSESTGLSWTNEETRSNSDASPTSSA
jgi:MFS family permease